MHASTHYPEKSSPLTFAFGPTDPLLWYLKDLSLKDKHRAPVVRGCLGRSAHTRMSWLMPRHSNGSCLHWSGLNSWPFSACHLWNGCCCRHIKGLQKQAGSFLFSWKELYAVAFLVSYTCQINEETINRVEPRCVCEWLPVCGLCTADTTSDAPNCCWRWAYRATTHQEHCTYISPRHSAGVIHTFTPPPPLWLHASLQLSLRH